ncbi:ankyrin repeat protein [Moumouvirus australiensis]|uniref:Ankyrin repeat protein n=1 Tax=Moumouvirus australiensis TaxID=2109587 RepID=A0A2P1EMW0_9VIRU|nr:ankyrin repeat protein [Moumouvirus australiensis]AVL95221.1 ankyrin repeat protein [Moumouvirus australiensis]
MGKFKYCLSCRYKDRILKYCKKYGEFHKLFYTEKDFMIVKFRKENDHQYLEIDIDDMINFMEFVMMRNYHCGGGIYDYYCKSDMKDIPLMNIKKIKSNDFSFDEDDLSCKHVCKHRQYTMEYVKYIFKHNMMDHIKLFLKREEEYGDFEGLFYSFSLVDEEDIEGYHEFSLEIVSSSLELCNYKTSKYIICNVYAVPMKILDHLCKHLKLLEIRKYLRICTSKKYFKSVSNNIMGDQLLNLSYTLQSIVYYDNINIFKFIVEEFYKVKNRVEEKYRQDYIFDKEIISQILESNDHKPNIAKFLITGKVNIESRINEALVNFCRQDLEMVKFLVNFGANIHTKGDEPLNQASKYGEPDIVQYLVDVGANINADKDKALISACSGNHLNVVKYLVKNGANINADNDKALMTACYKNNLDIIKYLIKNGANIYADNKRALIIVAKKSNRHYEIMNFFKEKGVDFNLVNEFFCDNWNSV